MTHKVWIITESYNDYNQHGEYFKKAFLSKPTKDQLKKFFGIELFGSEEVEEIINKLLNEGGGRIRDEYSWFNLICEDAE